MGSQGNRATGSKPQSIHGEGRVITSTAYPPMSGFTHLLVFPGPILSTQRIKCFKITHTKKRKAITIYCSLKGDVNYLGRWEDLSLTEQERAESNVAGVTNQRKQRAR